MEVVLNTDGAKPIVLPAEVIGLILSNLKKADVLNSRLVSKSWNVECLRVLNKSNWTLPLNIKNIKRYIEFLKTVETPQLVLPLDLSTEYGYDMENDLEFLIRVLGEHCVQTMYLYIGIQYPANMALLAKACQGLEKLEIYEDETEITPERVKSLFSRNPVAFPYLKTFKGTTSEINLTFFRTLMPTMKNLQAVDLFGSDMDMDMDVLVDSLSNVESLEKLKVWIFKPTLAFLQKIQEIKPSLREFKIFKLKVENDGDAMVFVDILNCLSLFPTLKRLTVELSSKLIANFQFPVFPHLKHLRITDEALDHIQRINVNAHTFPALESWDVSIGVLERDEEENPALTLPYLKHLSVLTGDEPWTWNPNIFPALESLALDFRFFYARQTVKFPTVRVLRVIFYGTFLDRLPEIRLSDQYLRGNLKRFHTMFPTLSKIVLENVSDFTVDHREKAAPYFCTRFLKEFLMTVSGKNLKEIQVLNDVDRDRNYLGDVLRQLENPPRLLLQNFEGALPKPLKDIISTAWDEYLGGLIEVGVDARSTITPQPENNSILFERNTGVISIFKDTERIMMSLRSLTRTNPGFPLYDKQKTNFKLIAKYFPNLRELDVPAYWFENLEESVRWELIQDIHALFPGIILNRVEPLTKNILTV